MNKFFDKYSFILAFMVFIVFWNMVLGKKATESLLWVILIGMALTNVNSISEMFKDKDTNKNGNKQNDDINRYKGVFDTPQVGPFVRDVV